MIFLPGCYSNSHATFKNHGLETKNGEIHVETPRFGASTAAVVPI
jgi:hypothetical protein